MAALVFMLVDRRIFFSVTFLNHFPFFCGSLFVM